jgi:hypothetical protein
LESPKKRSLAGGDGEFRSALGREKEVDVEIVRRAWSSCTETGRRFARTLAECFVFGPGGRGGCGAVQQHVRRHEQRGCDVLRSL